jgi:hypothetical protein
MPKLDGTHIAERLKERIAKLKNGEEVAARDLRALLTDEQTAALDAAKKAQQELKKAKRARTKEEEKALGWKSIREIHIEALEAALKEAEEDEVGAWEKRMRDAEIRQARIYFDTLESEIKAGKELQTAKNKANNDLTRAGLRRMDGQIVGHLSKRDKEISELEAALIQQATNELDDYEKEQLELLKAHNKAVEENRKKRSK